MGALLSKPPKHEDDDKEKGEEEEEEVEVIEEGKIHAVARDWYLVVEIKLALRMSQLRTENDVPCIGRKHLSEFFSIREARNDIESFYRCFAFSYLEHILDMQDSREVNRMLAILEKYERRDGILAGKTTSFPAFCQVFRDLLSSYSEVKNGIVKNGIASFRHRRELLRKFQDEETPMKIILLLRMIVAIEIHIRKVVNSEQVYGRNLEKFCIGGVAPVSGQHVHAEILCNALRVPLRVVNLPPVDLAPPGTPLRRTREIPNPVAATSGGGSTSASAAVRKRAMAPFEITLLYRPDKRYGILYREEVTFCGLGEFLL